MQIFNCLLAVRENHKVFIYFFLTFVGTLNKPYPGKFSHVPYGTKFSRVLIFANEAFEIFRVVLFSRMVKKAAIRVYLFSRMRTFAQKKSVN